MRFFVTPWAGIFVSVFLTQTLSLPTMGAEIDSTSGSAQRSRSRIMSAPQPQPRLRPRVQNNLQSPNKERVLSLSDISLVGQPIVEYTWAYELSDGTQTEQKSFVKNPLAINDEAKIHTITGFYSYLTPEGHTVNVSYVADDRGFQPIVSSPVVTPPPIPPEIERSLRILKKNAEDQLKREAEKNGTSFRELNRARMILDSQFPAGITTQEERRSSESGIAMEILPPQLPTTYLQPPRQGRRRGRRRRIRVHQSNTTTTAVPFVSHENSLPIK